MRTCNISLLLFLSLIPFISSTISSLPSTGTPPRIVAFSSLTSIEDKLYSFGGKDLDGDLTNEIHEFDLATSKWTLLQSTSQCSPSPRLGSVFTSYQGSLFLFGGQDDSGIREELWQYNIAAASWLQIYISIPATIARVDAASTLQGKFLYVFGGISLAGTDSLLLK